MLDARCGGRIASLHAKWRHRFEVRQTAVCDERLLKYTLLRCSWGHPKAAELPAALRRNAEELSESL